MKTEVFSGVTKIAVVRANALGDFIFALPALEALDRAYPDAQIVLLALEWHKAFLKNRPGPVDRVEVVPVYKGVGADSEEHEDPHAISEFFRTMKGESFDIAVQLHGGGRYSNPFTKRLGARLSIGMKSSDAVSLDRWIAYTHYQPEVFRYLEVVSLAGAIEAPVQPILHVTEKDRNESLMYVQNAASYVVLHPGASDPRRRWPTGSFAKIGDYVRKLGYHVYITGTRKEKELAESIETQMKEPCVNTAGTLSLSGLTGLLSEARLVISNDTGPFHMAHALGTPTIGIFWCGNVINAGPVTRNRNRIAISWMVRCPICGTDIATPGYPFEQNIEQCLHDTSFVSEVTVEEVYEYAQDLLSHAHKLKDVKNTVASVHMTHM